MRVAPGNISFEESPSITRQELNTNPSNRNLSHMSRRCGEVNRPVRKPDPLSMLSVKAQVEPWESTKDDTPQRLLTCKEKRQLHSETMICALTTNHHIHWSGRIFPIMNGCLRYQHFELIVSSRKFVNKSALSNPMISSRGSTSNHRVPVIKFLSYQIDKRR